LDVSLKSPDVEGNGIGLKYIGQLIHTIELLNNLGVREGTHIWTSGDSWLPLDLIELEEWFVEAIEGVHLIVCERETSIVELPSMPDGVELIFWNKDTLGSVLGEAMIQGHLTLNNTGLLVKQESHTEDIITKTEPSKNLFTTLDERDDLALTSTVHVDDVLDELGVGGTSTRPIMIRCRFWQIEGTLNGPNDELADKQWLLLEDPFTDSLDLIGDVEYLDNIPKFEIFERDFSLDNEGILSKIPGICNERRRQRVESDEGKVQISGKLLRWWKVDIDRIKLSTRTVLIPCWHIMHPLDGPCIIHGRNGRIIHTIT
jgi:hypothetical protein